MYVLIAVHVDDQLLVSPNIKELEAIKLALSNKWGIIYLGPVSTFLGMDIKRDRATHTLQISQARFTQDILNASFLWLCAQPT